ncbi:hypothetical protein [Luteolibacter soli]|uniref:Uncharacterized protein n=1 Tax=Luteolibacter soli TaxID=3135280 RepID=A0ABU9AS84_9BACT
MRVLPAILLTSIVCSINAHALEPSWNIRDATEKLLDKYALRLPVDDWFLERKDGSIVQLFKPSIVYTGGGAYWTAEVRTTKLRERKNGAWGAWSYAPPAPGSNQPGYFQSAVIDITTPSTGGASAKFQASQLWFGTFRAPTQSRVTLVR